MKKNMKLVGSIGGACLVSAGALAGYLAWSNPGFAEVVSVEPVRQFVASSDRACPDRQVSRRESATPESSPYAVVIDGMAGGVITRQPARIEKVATLSTVAAGDPAGRAVQDKKAVAKDAAPKKVADKSRSQQVKAATGTHCRKANRVSEKIVAYDVRYRFLGKTSKVRMDHDPGARLPVRNGKVVIVQDTAPKDPKA
jgi:uncharacterized protein YcfJ